MLKSKVVGVADCAVSKDEAESLATYALGSCIALMIHDPIAMVGGMLHFLLPDSSLVLERARFNPCLYADSGIPELLDRCLSCGADQRRLIVHAAGGASLIGDEQLFRVGEKNQVSLRKALAKAGLPLHCESIGGKVARSVRLDVGTGRMWIKEGAEARWKCFNNQCDGRYGS